MLGTVPLPAGTSTLPTHHVPSRRGGDFRSIARRPLDIRFDLEALRPMRSLFGTPRVPSLADVCMDTWEVCCVLDRIVHSSQLCEARRLPQRLELNRTSFRTRQLGPNLSSNSGGRHLQPNGAGCWPSDNPRDEGRAKVLYLAGSSIQYSGAGRAMRYFGSHRKRSQRRYRDLGFGLWRYTLCRMFRPCPPQSPLLMSSLGATVAELCTSSSIELGIWDAKWILPVSSRPTTKLLMVNSVICSCPAECRSLTDRYVAEYLPHMHVYTNWADIVCCCPLTCRRWVIS